MGRTILDTRILGAQHLYHGEGIAFDPEGILSTLPAIVQVIGGYLAGHYLMTRSKQNASQEQVSRSINPLYKTLTVLFVTAAALLFAGFAWNFTFPINKKIWTSSFVLYTTGLAFVVLAILVYGIELSHKRGWWSRFFEAFGKNPLFIYVLSGLIPRLLGLIRIHDGTDETGKMQFISPWRWFYNEVDQLLPGSKEFSSLFVALLFVFLLWALAYWMDRKKIYIRV